ncbi:MAG: hypothetical protein PF450_14765 [Bacteroidales bacterium]|jgi:hypothetical protein|nr:hypothetical protein [Bacteroidales bacterium]
MNLARKYDRTLRRRYSFRAVWLPGTDIKIGDILILKDGALVSVGNIGNEGIPFEEEQVGDMDSLDIKSTGVAKTLLQNGTKVTLDEIQTSGEVELKISFNEENSYLLKTSKLTGKGMVSALGIAKRIAKLANWDFQRNYVVHQVYHAEDFTFLGSATSDSSATFKGSAEAVRKFIEGGSSAELTRTSSQSLSIEVTDKEGGTVVMRLFRVKRNGEMY